MVCTKKLFKLSEICYKKRMRKKYPSDITKEQFEQLRSILESGRKKTAPRKVDLSEVILRHTVSVEKRLPTAYAAWSYFKYGKLFTDGVKALLGEQIDVSVVKRNEMHTFKVIPKRWVVERSFAWFEKQQRLWKNFYNNQQRFWCSPLCIACSVAQKI